MNQPNVVLYVHGKGGSAEEAAHYQPLFAGTRVTGLDYQAQTPWEARAEFPRLFEESCKGADSVLLIANSIGAYFSMMALADKPISRALFISPIVDMEQLICNMMRGADVTEETLQREKEIPTAFGETLSWPYLCDVRAHPLHWQIPTRILYGGQDCMTSRATISRFAASIGAPLTVMEEGEHWFHTEEQMRFLDRWLTDSTGGNS